MKLFLFPLLLLSLVVTSCRDEKIEIEKTGPAESFLPMEIGNYWRNKDLYTRILDTVRFDGRLYYKFLSVISNDMLFQEYLRIDDKKQLWSGNSDNSGKEYLKARFNAKLGDTFYILNDQSWNDYQVKLIEKSETRRVFEFDLVYHPYLKGQKHNETYIKGKGFDGTWDSIRISGVVYK